MGGGPTCLGIDVGSSNTKVVLAAVRPGRAGDRVDEVASAGAPTPAGTVELVGVVVDLVRRTRWSSRWTSWECSSASR